MLVRRTPHAYSHAANGACFALAEIFGPRACKFFGGNRALRAARIDYLSERLFSMTVIDDDIT